MYIKTPQGTKDSTTLLPQGVKTSDLKQVLFDRVVNLQIRRGAKKDDDTKNTFLIRSDYEVVYKNSPVNGAKGNSLTYQIQRCSHKPDIRVDFKEVTGSIGIEVDIMITNFHIFSMEGKTSLEDWDFKENPITSVEVVIGYAPMFPKPKTVEQYFGLDAARKTMHLEAPKGTSKLVLSTCNWVAVESAPPDSVFHIKGVVNSISAGLDYDTQNEKLADTADREDFTLNNHGGKRNFVEKLFYWLVQKRFLRQPSAFTQSKISSMIDSRTKLLKDSSAESYGCKVIVPEGSRVHDYAVSSYRDPETGKVVESDKGQTIYLPSGSSVAATLNMIQNRFFPTLRFAPLLDGNWVAWDVNDFICDDSDTKESRGKRQKRQEMLDFLNECYKAVNNDTDNEFAMPDKLVMPVAYSVSVSAAMVTIQCPFFAFLNPFQKVVFNSRYVYTTMGTYFTGTKGMNEFFVISSRITFSTTGHENLMILRAVGNTKVEK